MIRTANKDDHFTLLHLLDLNSPEYFAPKEKTDYIDYLENKLEKYFVFEENGEIIGAGGLNFFPEEKSARISWDMVHPNHHGKGIGRKLTEHRINFVKELITYKKIVVRTSQLAYPFYEKFGFSLVKYEENYWAEGFLLYHMEMTIDQ